MKVSMDRALVTLKALRPEHWLLLLAGVLAVLLLVQGVRYACVGRLARGMGEALEARDASALKRTDVPDLKAYEGIAKLGSLGSVSGTARLVGILGDSALFGTSPSSARPYAAGATVPGVGKIVDIGINTVVVEKDGKERTLKVFPELKMTPPKKPSGPPSRPGPPPTAASGKPPASGQSPETPAPPPGDSAGTAASARVPQEIQEKEPKP